MRINEATILVGEDVFLVPYRREHVPRYHEWMSDPTILEATASDPLTLDEEYAMQQTWHVDEDKLTFIILSRKDGAPSPEALTAGMIGDVNLFLSAKDDESSPIETSGPTAKAVGIGKQGELEIMVAEPSARRKGYATQALGLMMRYTLQNSIIQSAGDFLVKIGMQNTRSIAMFGKLGFKVVKEVAIFQEVEMRIRHQDQVTRWREQAKDPTTMLRC